MADDDDDDDDGASFTIVADAEEANDAFAFARYNNSTLADDIIRAMVIDK